MRLIQRLRMPGLLSFPPDMDFFDLKSLNVLIGPNASGKSNFIDTLELLSALPIDLAGLVRHCGGVREWLWKGTDRLAPATIEVETGPNEATGRPLRYRLSFEFLGSGLNVVDENIEEAQVPEGYDAPYFYYAFKQGRPVINIRVRTPDGLRTDRTFKWDERSADQSVLSQRKDPDLYPELFWIGWNFSSIQTFRHWTFGASSPLRQPQRADLPDRVLVFDSRNLALILNQIEHKCGPVFNKHLKLFFPRFDRMTTVTSGGTIQFYLHESGFAEPISAARLSDGTLRFIALLAILLSPGPSAPGPPQLVCVEEPELGLHPDAVALLADLLIEASERMQLVVTTHSDTLVSALTTKPDAIIACARPGAGTELRRLDPKKLASWLEEYRLGDLWRMGELGANP